MSSFPSLPVIALYITLYTLHVVFVTQSWTCLRSLKAKAVVVHAVPIALLPAGPSNLIAFALSLIRIVFLCLFLFFASLLGAHTTFKPFFQVHHLRKGLRPLGLRLGVVIPPFLTLQVRSLLSLPVLSRWKQMTFI